MNLDSQSLNTSMALFDDYDEEEATLTEEQTTVIESQTTEPVSEAQNERENSNLAMSTPRRSSINVDLPGSNNIYNSQMRKR